MIPLVSWVAQGKLHLVHNQPPTLMSNCLHLLLQSLELNEDNLQLVPQHVVHYTEIEDDCFISF